MKSELLSVATHELRTPISIIHGFAEALLNASPDEARQREFLGIIAAKMTLVSSIIDELAALARLEARAGEDFVFAPTDLGNLVREVVSVFAAPAGRAAPVLRLPAKPLFALGDRNQATRAITKALAHAYHWSLPGAGVRIAVRAQDRGEAVGSGGRMIGIHIIRQGVGGNGEEREPSRGRSSRFDAPGDPSRLGLGMSVVREIVDLHGGEVLVQSAARRGASIALLFPEAPKPKRAHGGDQRKSNQR